MSRELLERWIFRQVVSSETIEAKFRVFRPVEDVWVLCVATKRVRVHKLGKARRREQRSKRTFRA